MILKKGEFSVAGEMWSTCVTSAGISFQICDIHCLTSSHVQCWLNFGRNLAYFRHNEVNVQTRHAVRMLSEKITYLSYERSHWHRRQYCGGWKRSDVCKCWLNRVYITASLKRARLTDNSYW